MFGKKASHSDSEIIQGIRAGGIERERWEYILYRRHSDFVTFVPRKYKLSEEEARDAYTEAFLAVVEHILGGRFRGESSLKTYLSRIFRNKCVDMFRKNTTVKVEWVEAFPELPDESKDFLRHLVGKEAVTQLEHYLDRISARCREILRFSGGGYSPAEIAEEMGLGSARSASSQRYKCLEKLKQFIQEEELLG